MCIIQCLLLLDFNYYFVWLLPTKDSSINPHTSIALLLRIFLHLNGFMVMFLDISPDCLIY